MKFVLATDSFKESITSTQACDVMEKAIKKIKNDAEVVKVPMADGGEGTVEALVNSTGGVFVETEVLNPLGEKIKASYGILGNKETAVIEMAKASGIEIIKREDRNPLITTTYGTGQLIKHAIENGNRLFMMHRGEILVDIKGREKERLDTNSLLEIFEKANGNGEEGLSDRTLFG